MFYISQDLSMLCPITTQPAKKKKNQKDKKNFRWDSASSPKNSYLKSKDGCMILRRQNK